METFRPPVIPLCEPNLNGHEKQYMAEAVDSNWLSGGSFLRRFEQQLADYTGVAHAIGVCNGTSALQVALTLAGVEKGDLVLVPDLTFVATANAVKYLGAKPVMIDVDARTWLMDLDLLQSFLQNETYQNNAGCFHRESGRRIKAVVPVHLLGNVCEMEQLNGIAKQFALAVVEDAACSLGSFQNGRHSGTTGLLGTMSFNSNKIITTAGGGAILTQSGLLAKRARHLITQAKSHATEYIHDALGYNFRLVNPLAAIGCAQMEQLPDFLQRKKEVAAHYREAFADYEVTFQQLTPGTDSNYWHSAMLVNESRSLIAALTAENIEARPLWTPIHELPVFREDLYITHNSVASEVSRRGIMLPCSTSITDDQLQRVSQVIGSFLNVTIKN
ncbi:perosamine synthetase [Dyadobacter sp. BE34]|uniref:Perosamine synthetase n=1 Tax=Dyadobacter fermentans TaxID=94254 RepID=A0ABU1QTR6_9BACT|nr:MULTISPECIES: LegC family aminotransferase [Dyadobacter]MDR6804140.1 perosamine synthetase [Dyadobacter fermentans]MDR7041880.1 perosamine synthetase [Dyadobacter sp. BE242]MDR7196283.1 perosamine synthetase [Dyadobacter sp. BE34]MDR7213172.1 perosamine synthetase [Dyadobacter sp. BE31]MDR7261689.1 perosamine synthetase [Dyadobacter sp. BE32]